MMPVNMFRSIGPQFSKGLETQVKNLSSKLKELENYKELCEARILELSPQHPLPLKQQHLGTKLIIDPSQSNIDHELRRQLLINGFK